MVIICWKHRLNKYYQQWKRALNILWKSQANLDTEWKHCVPLFLLYDNSFWSPARLIVSSFHNEDITCSLEKARLILVPSNKNSDTSFPSSEQIASLYTIIFWNWKLNYSKYDVSVGSSLCQNLTTPAGLKPVIQRSANSRHVNRQSLHVMQSKWKGIRTV